MTAAAVESNTAPRSDTLPEVIGRYKPRAGNAAAADIDAGDDHAES